MNEGLPAPANKRPDPSSFLLTRASERVNPSTSTAPIATLTHSSLKARLSKASAPQTRYLRLEGNQISVFFSLCLAIVRPIIIVKSWLGPQPYLAQQNGGLPSPGAAKELEDNLDNKDIWLTFF